MNKGSIDLVLYHSPCNDGFGAAFVAWKFLGDDAEYIGLKPQEEPPSVKGKHVLAVDISWKRDVTERLHNEAASFLVLDHHTSAAKELDGLSYAVFDMNRSGVMMAWDFFYPELKIPKFLKYIGQRDIWQHIGKTAEKFCLAFTTREDFEAWDVFFRDNSATKECLELGHTIYPFYYSMLAQLASLATEHTWEGHQVLVINVGWPFTSELGHFLVEQPGNDQKIAFLWTKKVGQPYGVSLRSADNGPDVSLLAVKMGGGGHEHSAGFRTETLPELLFG